MSISADHVRITREEYDRILKEPSDVEYFMVGENMPPELGLDEEKKVYLEGREYAIGSLWQGIHYLLTDEVADRVTCRRRNPLYDMILGGTPVPYGDFEETVSILSPEEVQEVAAEIYPLDRETVRDLYLVRDHYPYPLYHLPPPDEWDSDLLELLLNSLDGLRSFYLEAAGLDQGMLIWLG